MNKQEAIDKLKKQLILNSEIAGSEFDKGYNYAIKIAIAAVVELDELEKPIVPQYVADMIVERKKQRQGIVTTIKNLSMFEKALKWVLENEEVFVKAWLYGYEVEKEKLYTVELPNPNSLDYLMLQKDRRGKISVAWYCTDSWQEDERVRLTESEIKKDFPWAWQFAEKVKE